ncbi:MAG: peptidylprolyl isomerase [Alphaproteobacteria bacterium]|nr:MAG: peptidylprolyl isomerase [Alphaproteobacteria bacterium]
MLPLVMKKNLSIWRRALFPILALALLALPMAHPAFAQEEDASEQEEVAEEPAAASTPAPKTPEEGGVGIAILVNDDVISTVDVISRVRLVYLTSGLSDTPEVRARVFPQIIRAMIDEQLQMQETRRLGIRIEPAEVEEAVQRVARGAQGSQGGLLEAMAANNIPRSALTRQIQAGLGWSRVVQQSLRPKVEIADDDVDEAISRLLANAGKPEYRVSEIFLAVDNPADEAKVNALAKELVGRIRSGTPFSLIAQQFSQSAGAVQGGDLGWVRPGQLAPALDEALQKMAPATISDPIRDPSGFRILGLREKRDGPSAKSEEVRVSMRQFFLPYGAGRDKKAALGEAESLRKALEGTAPGCKDLEPRTRDFPGWQGRDLGTQRIEGLPGWLRNWASAQDIGKPSSIYDLRQGAMIVMLCSRETVRGDQPNRETVVNALGNERLETLAYRLLRDLRRSAVSEVRWPRAADEASEIRPAAAAPPSAENEDEAAEDDEPEVQEEPKPKPKAAPHKTVKKKPVKAAKKPVR